MSRKKKEIPEIFCPQCGERSKSRKDIFCAECGHGLFTPRITGGWSLRVILGIIAAVTLIYILFLHLKPHLYFMLDTV